MLIHKRQSRRAVLRTLGLASTALLAACAPAPPAAPTAAPAAKPTDAAPTAAPAYRREADRGRQASGPGQWPPRPLERSGSP